MRGCFLPGFRCAPSGPRQRRRARRAGQARERRNPPAGMGRLRWVTRLRRQPTRRTRLCIDTVHTTAQSPAVSKDGPSPRRRSAATAAVARRSSAEAKGSINLRIEAGTRALIDDAAAALGKTRTEFMVDSARRQAVDVLLDQRLFALAPEGHDAFLAALDDPPAPGPKLSALMRRVPAWQK